MSRLSTSCKPQANKLPELAQINASHSIFNDVYGTQVNNYYNDNRVTVVQPDTQTQADAQTQTDAQTGTDTQTTVVPVATSSFARGIIGGVIGGVIVAVCSTLGIV